MKIVYYEMRKSFFKISALILLIILTLLNIVRIYDLSRTRYTFTAGDFHEPYFRLYKTVCGELSEEKLSPFKKRAEELREIVRGHSYSTEYEPEKYEYTGYCFGDFNLYNTFIGREITYCGTYPNTSNQIVVNAYDNYQTFTSVGNGYEAEKSAMIYKAFQNRNIPEYRATYWTNLFFNYDFSSLLCVIMLIFCLSSSFTNEKTSGMKNLISAYGKNVVTIRAKIISAALCCIMLTVYFTVCDLLTVHVLLGIDGLDMPLYSAEFFKFSPYNFSFTSAIFLWVAQRFAALFAISMIVLLISKLSPNVIISMMLNFAAIIGLILITIFSDSVFDPIRSLIPSSFMQEFAVVNICGKPVPELLAVFAALAAECVVLCFVIGCSGGRRNDKNRV